METLSVRKTYMYRLKPTPQQERELERVLGLCRWLYNTAVEQCKMWWQRGQGKGGRGQRSGLAGRAAPFG
jgi:hypothetical protein